MSNLFRLPYLQQYTDRHGQPRVYFRHGSYRVRLPSDTRSNGFLTAYEEARANDPERLRHGRAERQARPVSVYILTDGERVKIGIATRPERRRQSLQTGSARRVEVVKVRPFKDRRAAYDAERALHVAFSASRLSGEWFAIQPNEAVTALEAV